MARGGKQIKRVTPEVWLKSEVFVPQTIKITNGIYDPKLYLWNR